MRPDITDMPPEFENAIGHFLDATVRTILRHESAEHYLGQVDALMEQTGFGEWFDPGTPYWVIAHSIWNASSGCPAEVRPS